MRGQSRLIGSVAASLAVLGGLLLELNGCGKTNWEIKNQPPILAAIGAQSVREGRSLTFTVTASDPDGDSLTLWVENPPDNSLLTRTANGQGTFAFYPNFNQDTTGFYPVFMVSDGRAIDSETVAIVVVDSIFTHHAGIISQNQTWLAVNNPHLVAGDIEIEDGAVVTIQAGCKVYFNDGKRIRVGYNSPGGFVAVGTPTQQILFTSVSSTPQPGSWDGLTFSAKCLPSSRLNHCIVEYGGGNGFGDVFVDDGAMSITNCILRQSSTNGVTFGGEGYALSFQDNMISGNLGYPASISCNRLGSLAGSSLTGNTRDTLVITGTRVNASATWDTLGVPLRVASMFEVTDGATLTILAGNRLAFDRSTGIKLGKSSRGSLIAAGTVEKPILFTTSQSKSPGGWEGLLFYDSTILGSSLAHCVVEYGGQTIPGNVFVQNCEVAIRDCTIRTSKQYGVYFTGRGRFSSFENNTLIENNLNPVRLSATYVHNLPATTAYRGNRIDFVDVFGDTLMQNSTWPYLGIPYLVSGTVRVDNVTLVLAPRDSLYFSEAAEIVVGAGAGAGTSVPAALIADGTDGRILMTAANPLFPWTGLRFFQSVRGTDSSRLVNCTISYGAAGAAFANVYMTNCTVTIRNCRITNSRKEGIYCEGQPAYPTNFEENVITANAGYPVAIDCNYIGKIPATNNYTGNGGNGFKITGARLDNTATWANLGVPLVISSNIAIRGGQTLTLLPGIELQFEFDIGLTISNRAALVADGTLDTITFRNAPAKGADPPFRWRGLVFMPGASSTSKLIHCVLRRGGSVGPGGDNRPGIVHVDSCTITITDCLIDSSYYNGVYFKGPGFANDFHRNTITGCWRWPLRVDAQNVHLLPVLPDDNVLTGNVDPLGVSYDAIKIGGSEITSSVTWPRLSVPYYRDFGADGSIGVLNNLVLTIQPGVTLLCAGGFGGLDIGDDSGPGRLKAEGTEADSIYFVRAPLDWTGSNWSGLMFQKQSATPSSLKYCVIDRAGNGQDPGTYPGSIHLKGSAPSITNCRISGSDKCGIYLEGSPVPKKEDLLLNNFFEGNNDGDVCP